MDIARLKRPARIVVRDCLNVKKGEKAVVVTDRPCRMIGMALWQELKGITDPAIVEFSPREIHGEEPPALIADILKKCDVFIIPTSHSLTHTQARINAVKAGARGATMPGITPDIMMRTLNADYSRIARLTHRIAALLDRTNKVLIRTELGTDLRLVVRSRRGHPDTGIIKRPGDFSNLPAGEAYIAPIEHASAGVAVIDGSFAPMGTLSRPVRLEITRGAISAFSGNDRVRAIFSKYGKKERVLCELGIGTNYKATITGNVLEDEKVMGTIHIAFGNNMGFGGRNNAGIHLDGIIKKPSVWFDNRQIIERGKVLV
jgi:leucyl aminopeptidase (aminopeptidase T)